MSSHAVRLIMPRCPRGAGHAEKLSVMDLRTHLQTTLKNKYQALNEAYSENPLLHARLCYKDDYSFSNLHKHDFLYVDKSHLHTWTVSTTVPLTDILSCECKHSSSRKTVLTLGVSGAGKTTVVQRCALEWAEGKGYHDIYLLLPLAVWELNFQMFELSLIELLLMFYPELKELNASSLNKSNVWFVLDGLDEFDHLINFSCPAVSDVSEASRVTVLVTNLIRGNLLPNSHVWITTRYAAATQIPQHYLLKVTEVQGFSDEQKEQHFRTVIGNDELTHRAIDHVKMSKSLDFLCQIPVICIIMANAFKNLLKADDGFKISPLNLTQIYTNVVKASNSAVFAKLKRLALLRMAENNLMSEGDLLQSDISIEEASSFSKEWPFVLREEKGLCNTIVFRFGHSSIQEFLAASAKLDDIEENPLPLRSGCCRELVDKALRNATGKFDVFLRFIFGLIKERGTLEPKDRLFTYTKTMILERSSVGLFHCLREYDSQALLNEVNDFLKSGVSPFCQTTPQRWKLMVQITRALEGMLRFSNLTDKCCPALAAVLSTKESYLRKLDLGYNSISDNGVRTLVEGLTDKNCRLKALSLQGCGVTSQACRHLNSCSFYLAVANTAFRCHRRLSQCNIEQMGCYYLASALQNNSSHLTELDLSINMVGDKGANEIFENSARLHKRIAIINHALKSEDSSLAELNLSNNSLKDAGFAVICEGMYAWCSLKKLNVSRCGITRLGCGYLARVLSVELQDLDLSLNCLEDMGVKEISDGLKNPLSHLKTLNLSHCSLTDDCCAQLASGISSKQGIIGELDLSGNDLQDKGVRKLCVGLRNPHCKLKLLS
uniref:NACHT domain-containing protein n=1 Tax=Monopterus albus TaxID=43700 RepID=A0A3Q3IPJ9_MONAL